MPVQFARIRPLLIVVILTRFAAVDAFAEEKPPEPALKGYDPTSYLLTGKPVMGDPAHQLIHEGDLYRFTSAETKKQFEAEPAKYLPQFGGLCTTALGGTYGNRLPSDADVFEIVDGKLYLFSSERAKKAYEKDKLKYIRTAGTLWDKPELSGYCPVSYQTDKKAVKGGAEFKAVYKGHVYHLTSAAAKAEFLKGAERYIPQYRNYCAVGVSLNKRHPADGSRFRVTDNKTYLLFDAAAEAEFDKSPPDIIKKADEKWVTLKDMK